MRLTWLDWIGITAVVGIMVTAAFGYHNLRHPLGEPSYWRIVE